MLLNVLASFPVRREGGGREGGEGGKGSEEEGGGGGREERKGGVKEEREERKEVRKKRKGGEGGREGREEGRQEVGRKKRKGERENNAAVYVHQRTHSDTHLQASRYPLMMEVGWILNLTSCSACFKSSAATITCRSGHKVKWDTSTQVLYCPEHATTSMQVSTSSD